MQTLGVLGPEGSFTDSASGYLKDYKKVYFETISCVVKAVKNGEVSKGIVPIENALEGTVTEALDSIFEYGVNAEKAVVLVIHYCIAAISRNAKIMQILSHPQALSQCRHYLEKKYPRAQLVKTLSTSEACKRIIDEKITNAAALCSANAAKLFKLEILDINVEDEKINKTKFFIISMEKSASKDANKTFAAVYPTKDVQGILYKMLGYFNDEKINLSKIESRPSRKELGNYLFYVEFDGNAEDAKVKRALKNIRDNIGDVSIIGCYDQVELPLK